MPRARNIKPAFFANEYLAELPYEARLLFIGLWTLADRRGRLEDRPKGIKGRLFPFDNIDTDKLLQELADSPERFIIRYSCNGKRFIQITNFEKHQNPHCKEPDSEIPPPPEDEEAEITPEQQSIVTAPYKHSANTVQTLCKHSTSTAETLNLIPESPILNPDTPSLTTAPTQDEDGLDTEHKKLQPGESLTVKMAGTAAGKGTREQPSKTLAERRFDEFWAAYPKKVGKKAAESSWKKIKPDAELHDRIMTAIGRARVTEQWQREGGRYIPNPATWLNQGRWDDEYEEVTQPYGSNSQHSRFKLAWEEDDNDTVINKQHTGPNKAGGFALSGFHRAEDAEWYKDEDTDEPKKQDGGALAGFKQSDDSG